MNALEGIEGLSECIGRAIQEHLAKSNLSITWPQIDSLDHPILRFEAFVEDASAVNTAAARSEKVASQTLDLTGMKTPQPSQTPTVTCNIAAPYAEGPRCWDDQESVDDDNLHDNAAARTASRKGTGGLRVANNQLIREDVSEHQRQMQVDTRTFPKRRKMASEKFVFQPSTLDKLIVGIWEQVHGSIHLDPQAIFEQFQIASKSALSVVNDASPGAAPVALSTTIESRGGSHGCFSQSNLFCRRVTQASRVCRSIEIIVQARWTELFDEQVLVRTTAQPGLSSAKHRKGVFMEACQDFGWSEKELRNKIAIWRGYKDVKDAAGWAALIFAGMGIYRFCKYRVAFDKEAMRRLRNLRKRLEVAADTLHPHWRRLLVIVDGPQALKYPGHPHEWVVYEDGSDPMPLRQTYIEHDPFFSFEHIEESVIDESVWGCEDPRWMPQENAVSRADGTYNCALCNQQQSDDAKLNACFCFPSLFGSVKRKPPPIQIYRTAEGKNNGLLALTSFDRGAGVGELVGLITKGVRHVDVMEGSTPLAKYQIWQGRLGNYTRFANHSCKPNAQTSNFTWLDTQRVILVSKGIQAGSEITVDYGDKYWAGLDKSCLCGETCCRYKRDGRRRDVAVCSG